MNVREIMQSPAPQVHRDARVGDMASEILKSGLPGLPVVDETGRPIGVVNQRDLVAKHAKAHLPTYIGFLGYVMPFETHRMDEEVQRVLGVTAGDLMEERFKEVGPDTDVDDAATIMVDDKVDLLLVTENDRLVGVLSDADIIRLLVIEESDADQSET